MPYPETADLVHKAVLWSAEGGADEYGRHRVGAANEISCRWVWGTGLISNPLERNESISATIAVDRRIKIGSILFRGTLEELRRNIDQDPDNYVQVVSYDETPDDKGRRSRKVVTVERYSAQLPVAI